MSKYTAEQVEAAADCLPDAYEDQAAKLRNYAALLSERESARAEVTDEVIWKAARALFNARKNNFPLGTGAERRWNRDKSMYFLDAQCALEAVAPMLASARVLDGWQLVPREPTSEMVKAGDDCGFRSYTGTWSITPDACWKAMLTATPKPEKE